MNEKVIPVLRQVAPELIEAFIIECKPELLPLLTARDGLLYVPPLPKPKPMDVVNDIDVDEELIEEAPTSEVAEAPQEKSPFVPDMTRIERVERENCQLRAELALLRKAILDMSARMQKGEVPRQESIDTQGPRSFADIVRRYQPNRPRPEGGLTSNQVLMNNIAIKTADPNRQIRTYTTEATRRLCEMDQVRNNKRSADNAPVYVQLKGRMVTSFRSMQEIVAANGGHPRDIIFCSNFGRIHEVVIDQSQLERTLAILTSLRPSKDNPKIMERAFEVVDVDPMTSDISKLADTARTLRLTEEEVARIAKNAIKEARGKRFNAIIDRIPAYQVNRIAMIERIRDLQIRELAKYMPKPATNVVEKKVKVDHKPTRRMNAIEQAMKKFADEKQSEKREGKEVEAGKPESTTYELSAIERAHMKLKEETKQWKAEQEMKMEEDDELDRMIAEMPALGSMPDARAY